MVMTKRLTSSLTHAFETLYTRRCSAEGWVKKKGGSVEGEKVPLLVSSLPLIAKYTLLASFIASTNPPKSDIHLFGRGKEGRGGKKRGGGRRGGGKGGRGGRGGRGGGRGGKKSGTTDPKGIKIPQRLLGPLTFPLDRMLAILGGLMEEHDASSRFGESQEAYTIPGEWTDNQISKSGVLACVRSLFLLGIQTYAFFF